MTLLKKLKSHRGGLVRLPTRLYWYDRGWDGTPGRVCLLLDAAATIATAAVATTAGVGAGVVALAPAAAYLLIDGQPGWVWVAEGDVELL